MAASALYRRRDGTLTLPGRFPTRLNGIKGWMVKLNARDGGGIELDKKFFIEWPKGHLPHQVRLQGGDASSDSYCFP